MNTTKDISIEEYEKTADENINRQTNDNCTDYASMSDALFLKMKYNQIEHALANVRAAIGLTTDEKVLAQLMSAEHHLTREV